MIPTPYDIEASITLCMKIYSHIEHLVKYEANYKIWRHMVQGQRWDIKNIVMDMPEGGAL